MIINLMQFFETLLSVIPQHGISSDENNNCNVFFISHRLFFKFKRFFFNVIFQI